MNGSSRYSCMSVVRLINVSSKYRICLGAVKNVLLQLNLLSEKL